MFQIIISIKKFHYWKYYFKMKRCKKKKHTHHKNYIENILKSKNMNIKRYKLIYLYILLFIIGEFYA